MKEIEIASLLLLLHIFPTMAHSENMPPIIDMHMHSHPIHSWGLPDGVPVPRITFPMSFIEEQGEINQGGFDSFGSMVYL